MLAHQEPGGATVAAAEVEDGRVAAALAEPQVEELAQQSMRAPAAAEVVEHRPLAQPVVQALEEAQQRIVGRDAPIDVRGADANAQIVVEQRWGGTRSVERGGGRGARGGSYNTVGAAARPRRYGSPPSAAR